MKAIMSMILLIATVSSVHAEPAARIPAHSSDILLRLHPRAWQPLITTAQRTPGMRLEPDTGETVDPATLSPLGAQRTTHPLADIPVQTRADGSRFAVLGGRLRSYSVVSIAPDGRLIPDCVHSEQEAVDLVRTHAKSGGR